MNTASNAETVWLSCPGCDAAMANGGWHHIVWTVEDGAVSCNAHSPRPRRARRPRPAPRPRGVIPDFLTRGARP